MVGFTGHRDLADPKQIAVQINSALDRLTNLCGPLATVSSMAEGADLIFLEVLFEREKKPTFWLVVPFPSARLEKDFSPADWLKATAYLKSALQVEEINSAPSDEEAYMEAGEFVADQADVIIAVWDGQSAAGLGGTADVVARARKLEKPLLWINSQNGKIENERMDRLKKHTEVPVLSPKLYAEQFYGELDLKAQRDAPKARHLIQGIILLHLLASAVGLSAPVFGWWQGPIEQAIGLSEFFVLSIAIFLTSAHRRRHEEWLQARIEAEICRSYLATWQIRRRSGHSFKVAVPGFGHLCKNLRLLQSLDTNPAPALTEACQIYLAERIQKQKKYFKDQSTTAQKAHAKLKAAALSCSISALLLTASCVVVSLLGIEGFLLHVPKFLSLVLPLVSAALFSIILTLEYSRRAARYEEMVAFLEDKVKRLQMVKTWNGLIRIATETEEQLLQEVVEWHVYSRFVATSH